MIRERDRGARRLLREVRKRPTVKVGVLAEKGGDPKELPDGSVAVDTVADVATMHEFGIGVPRRSFIADWSDESLPEAKRRLRKAAQRIVGGERSLEQELDRFGLWAVGSVQERMAKGIPPPNSPVTIRRKGSDKPLIDTGQLRSSVTHEVDDG